MPNNKSYTALFSLMISLLITWVLLAGLNALAPAEGDHWTHLFVRRGPAPMLSLFFGIYCVMIIRHFAIKHKEIKPYFRLLLLFCLFPAGVGIVGTTLIQRDFEAQVAVIEAKATEEALPALQEKHAHELENIRQPLKVGVAISVIDVLILFTALQRTKGQKKKDL